LEGYGAATIIHFPENPVPGSIIEGKTIVLDEVTLIKLRSEGYDI